MTTRSIACLLLLVPALAAADRAPYRDSAEVRAEAPLLHARHRHDAALSSLEVTTADGAPVFSMPSPRLTYLWVSEDSRYIVGMSHIKHGNPLQLVVWTARGERLLAQPVTPATWPSVTETVTNFVHWYREPEPAIALTQAAGTCTLTIEDRTGVARDFRFGCPPWASADSNPLDEISAEKTSGSLELRRSAGLRAGSP